MHKFFVTTVTGDVSADQLGATLIHEHLYCDIPIHSGKADNRINDVDLIASELGWFRKAGGRSIVEVTPEGVGRDVRKLREISLAAGVQVISGTALYDQSTYPEWVRTATVDKISDHFVQQIEEGYDGARAGLIGELASHNEPVPNPAVYRLQVSEARVFASAARAQRRTGVAISTHASFGRAGHAQLNVLEKAGADLTRVAIGHCDAHWHQDIDQDLAYYLPILERGAYCQFDMIGWQEFMPDKARAERIAALIRLGYAGRITLSTDTCRLSQLHQNGGRGLDYVWTTLLPRLRNEGVDETSIKLMLEEAPRTFLSRRRVRMSNTCSLYLPFVAIFPNYHHSCLAYILPHTSKLSITIPPAGGTSAATTSVLGILFPFGCTNG